MKVTIPVLTSAIALSLLSAPAQAKYAFSAWNENSDNMLSKEEWNEGFDRHGVFEELGNL